MDFVECGQGDPNPTGFVIAMDAKTGKQKWRYKGMPFESSPLLHDGILYVGSWDGNVHAIRAKTGRRVWTYETGNRVNTSAAYSKGRIFIANQDGNAVRAERQDRQAGLERRARPRSSSTPPPPWPTAACSSAAATARCTPTAPRTGKLLWARPLGTYIYSSAAVYDKKVYAGTLRRQVLRARRRHRRREMAAHDGQRGARPAGGDERPGLRGHVRHLRLGGVALREDGQGRHHRVQRAHRQGGAGATTPASTPARSSPTRTASTSRGARTSTRWRSRRRSSSRRSKQRARSRR